MIPCTVEPHYSCYLVTFEDGKSILLQSDYDQASFAASSGLFSSEALENFDGRPSTLVGWEDFDMTAIEECPDEYYDLAE